MTKFLPILSLTLGLTKAKNPFGDSPTCYPENSVYKWNYCSATDTWFAMTPPSPNVYPAPQPAGQTNCRIMDSKSNLARIMEQAENEAIVELGLTDPAYYNSNYWLAGSHVQGRTTNSDVWLWEDFSTGDGETRFFKMTYTNWAENMPPPNSDIYYLLIGVSMRPDGSWQDQYWSDALPAICEIRCSEQ